MRKNVLVLVALTTLASTALAGCTGDGEGKAPGEDPTSGPLESGKGVLEVGVTDEIFNPLKDATVTLHELEQDKTTDNTGKATFSNLEPGRYTVFASKLGYQAGGKTLTVAADLKSVLQFQLITIPPPAQPFQDNLTFSGFVSCSVGLRPLQTQDACAGEGSPFADPNAKAKHNFPLQTGLTGVHVLMQWTQGQGVNLGNTLSLTWTSPAGINPNNFAGKSPLVREYVFTENDTFTQVVTEAVIDVRASSGGPIGNWQDASILVWQQPYKLYVTLFYNGMTVPEGYSPIEQ